MGGKYKIDREYAAEVGKRLIGLRTERGLTQVELSEKTGLDRTLISQYEGGLRTPDVAAWIALASFFGVSTDYIAGTSRHRSFKGHSICDKIELNRLNDMGKDMLFKYYHMLIDCRYTKNYDYTEGKGT